MDTDVFIEILRHAPRILTWLSEQSPAPYLSGIAALEAAFGSQSASELRTVARKRAKFDILWPNAINVEAATSNLAKARLSHGIGALDAITAAVALRHGIPVVTFNVKHFRGVPGLNVVAPY
jgi:predicted nucleic acid-binding protein